jgi:hypothetical protein
MSFSDEEIRIFTRLWKWTSETWRGSLTFAGVIIFAGSMISIPVSLYLRSQGRVARMPEGTLTVRCTRTPKTSCSVAVLPP